SFSADLGNGSVSNASTPTSCYACPDLFIAKYAAATGNHLFSTTHGVDADDIASDVAINPVTGSAIVTGSYQLALDVGAPQTLLPVSARNAFVLSLGPLP
ncbi:MAG TPA: hypothetical protein VFB62_11415, partial [Polyangiaceae bacterium]|nr:hypothetical protein [Polyangiaceae bacterium]